MTCRGTYGMRAAGERALALRISAEQGRVRSVLVEQPGFGRSEHFLPVRVNRGAAGDVVVVTIGGTDGKTLLASAIREAA